jgi:outer membrane protein OmpA-like peptidoglycan-associated protein
MKHIKILACASMLFAYNQATAQQFSVEFNGGFQGTQYKISEGKTTLQPGGSLGLNYTFLFNNHWGLLAGIGAGYFSTKSRLNDGTYSSYQVDDAGSAFEYKVSTNGYAEQQHFLAASIPVMAEYHTTGEGLQWYIQAGTRIIIPMNATIKASAPQLTTTGYYPDYNIEVGNLPQHGFSTTSNWKGETTTTFKPTATASIATGISFPLGRDQRLYTGIYADQGLTGINKQTGDQPLVTYTGNTNTVLANSLLRTRQAGTARMMAIGLQVRISFGMHPMKKTKVPTPTVTDQIPEKVKDTIIAAVPKEVVADTVSKSEAPAEQPGITAISREQEAAIQQPVVFKTLAATAVPERMKSHLDSIAAILKEHAELRVAIVGHTCNIGTPEQNKSIGEARAKNVAVYLEEKGIALNRMDISSAGSSQPLVPNTSEKNKHGYISIKRVVSFLIQPALSFTLVFKKHSCV